MSDRKIKVSFLGAVGQVTGSNFLLEKKQKKILIDCGLFQGSSMSYEDNHEEFPYNPNDIDFLFVTHGHLDHVGRIPKLVKEGFKGRIFSTPQTKEISKLILEDALRISNYKKREENEGEPLYNENDLRKAFDIWENFSYDQIFNIDEEFEVVLKNSGHILGSAMVVFKFSGQKESIVFTGDLGSWPNPLLEKTDNLKDVKYITMESVYGDKNQGSIEERDKIFRQTIEKIIKNKGTLLIPSFSLERAQVIIFELNKLVESKIIPAIPVFLDSPLAIKLLHIYKKSSNLFNEDVRDLIESGDHIFSFPNLTLSENSYESKSITKTAGPKIIIAGSGMSQGGRIVFHEEEYLPGEENILMLVGYQAVGTLGRALQEGIKEVTIKDKKVKVKAEIVHLDSFSAHKDSDGLLKFVEEISENSQLEKVFVVMGEPKASLFLAQRIRDYLGLDAVVPEKNSSYDLDL